MASKGRVGGGWGDQGSSSGVTLGGGGVLHWHSWGRKEDQLSLGPVLGGSLSNQPPQGLIQEAPDMSRWHTQICLGPPPSGLAKIEGQRQG